MNTKKATKLDMDDRAKIIQYFSKANNYGLGNGENALESVRIEDMFGTCWSVPMALPALPTVITVQVLYNYTTWCPIFEIPPVTECTYRVSHQLVDLGGVELEF